MAGHLRSRTMTRQRFLVAAFYTICAISSLQVFFVSDRVISIGSGSRAGLPNSGPSGKTSAKLNIHRIFYFNAFTRADKNWHMKKWLSAQSIPFHRIEAFTGSPSWGCRRKLSCYMNIGPASTYSYLLEYGGFELQPSLPGEFNSNSSVDLPFGERPHYTHGHSFFNLSGTTLVLHQDDIYIPDTAKLQFYLGSAIQSGAMDPYWDVVRLHCCPQEEESTNQTRPESNFTLGMHTNRWLSKGGTIDALLWNDVALKRLSTDDNEKRLEQPWESNFHTFNLHGCFCKRRDSFPREPQMAVKRTVLPREPKVSLQRIQQQYALRKGAPRKVERIFYSNLEKNVKRKTMMNFWLNEDPLRRVPFKRIGARIGDPSMDQCITNKNITKRCQGVAGLARTLLHILDNEDTTGMFLVLEDDFFISDSGFRRLEASLAMVPDDWDMIRFDCRDINQVDLQWLNPFVARSNEYHTRNGCVRCFFCGGTHAIVMKGESTEKIKAMWGQTPFDDVDCVIGRTKWVNSYCVNIGVGDMYYFDRERSDIPKN